MSGWLSPLLDLIFPPVCAACGEGLGKGEPPSAFRWRGHGICEACLKKLPWLHPPYCPRCASPIPSSAVDSHLCGDCLLDPPPFESARALVVYQREVFPVVHQMKYGPRPSLARFMGALLAQWLGGELENMGIEEILPVPLHPKRLRERGFNQAGVMAGPVANRLHLRVNHGVVKRVRWTSPQVGLTKPQREMNLRNAFQVEDRRGVAEKRWLLVDDVYTTGSTLREVTRTLKRAGASEVHVLTFARVE